MPAAVITSSANALRIARAREWLEAKPAGAEILILAANLDAANELIRSIAMEKGAIFGWHRLTLPQAAATIAAPALAGRQEATVSRIAADALVARCLHFLRSANQLGRFQPIAETPGFPRSIARVVNELRLARVSVDVLRHIAPDLAHILTAFENELNKERLADWPGLLVLAAETVRGNPKASNLIGLPLLLLDVPIASKAEGDFLAAIAAAAPDVLATVSSADEMTIGRIREIIQVQPENLDSAAGSNGARIAPISLSNLQQRLFDEQRSGIDRTSDGAVQVFSAPGEGRECIEIARRVLSLAGQGVPFDRIAVLLRSPEAYRTNLAEAFNRARIPTHFVRGTMRPDPSARAFCALLRCASEDLSANRFAEYLSLGQLPGANSDGIPPAAKSSEDRWNPPDVEMIAPVRGQEPDDYEDDAAAPDRGTAERPVAEGGLRAPRRWERLLVEAAVIGGRDRWHRRIHGLIAELKKKIEVAQKHDESLAATLARSVSDLIALSAYALPLIDTLSELPATASWGDWIEQLGSLSTRAVRKPERVLATLTELAPMSPIEPVTLNDVLFVLEDVLLETAAPPSTPRYGKVFVGPTDAARGMCFDAVFVPGLAERMFPGKIVEEPILLDGVRDQIASGLATNQTRLAGERLALAIAAGAAEQAICLSYPRVDLDQARSRVPSFYALEAMRAAEGTLPDFAELAKRAETATVARLGWPAPQIASEAIDDAEHDLAVLGQLVVRGDVDAGAARYLLTANPHLARSLRARYQRWGRTWTQADGLVSQSEATRNLIARHSLSARSYSPTALQSYARCPYRFFLQAIQRLEPRDVPEAIDQLDPLQRGSLIHEVQFQLFAHLRQEKLLPVSPASLPGATQVLERVLADVGVRFHDELAPAIERVWQDGIAAIHTDLREWLRRMSDDDSGYVPVHFELTFGTKRLDLDRLDPRSVEGAIALDCGVQLRGSIDLVESHPSGFARVTDHKTGGADAAPDQVVDGGKSLQPLFYALAAEKLLSSETKIGSGRLYYCTSVGSFSEHTVQLNDGARAAASKIADIVEAAITDPFLPAAPGARECQHCSYRPVCGPYEERRVIRKPQDRLEPLLELREMR